MRQPLTVTIITLNEAAHIGAAIDSAAFADELIVVDSGSTDGTTDMARAKGARVLTRAWTGYVDQKNFAAEQARHDWIFSLDADERIPPALADEIKGVLEDVGTPDAERFADLPRIKMTGWVPIKDSCPAP